MISHRLVSWVRFSIALIVALTLVVPVLAQQPVRPSGAALVKALRHGGYVLLLRHMATNHDQADTDPLHLENVAQQRQLSDEGRAHAKRIGEAIRRLGIPIASVTTSLFFRAQETATLLNVGPMTTSLDITDGGLVVSPNENHRRAQALLALLTTQPPAGKNVVLISHKPNIVEVLGQVVFDAQEGECFIVQPDGMGNFELVARVKVEEWPTLVTAR